jgi:hypothetical protein
MTRELSDKYSELGEIALSGTRNVEIPSSEMEHLAEKIRVRIRKDLDPEWNPLPCR